MTGLLRRRSGYTLHGSDRRFIRTRALLGSGKGVFLGFNIKIMIITVMNAKNIAESSKVAHRQ